MANPSQLEIETRLQHENLAEWLRLWRAEQGPAKQATLELMASVIPGARQSRLRVLDLCCGPGDAGRTIHAHFPNAEVDAVDRDIFLTGVCKIANRQAGVAGRTLLLDLNDPDWHRSLGDCHDVVVIANALHWFSMERAKALVDEVFALLRPGGVFVFMEPVRAESAFATGFDRWRAAQPAQHRREDWTAFWSRVNDFLGYDHIDLLGEPPAGRIDENLTVGGWVEFARAGGFASVDILLRDAEKVAVAALKPQD